jgi:type I restriction-modification system DNA methylase subunit
LSKLLIDDVLWREAGCTTELDYTAQTSWLLLLKYLDDLEQEKHELSHLYEAKIKNMGNAGRNGGEYYTPRPLIRAMIGLVQSM